ncbi:tRNA lysidine(34) synthetase TilS [Aliiroseovarius sp. YM-037]|uniref:tRNA lysidine(34) synthetase TilS n=1 Tax=Aliiroseovarius sp. YM-037 TaxID=3341728 RepID=UPI003A7FCBB9
MSESALAGIVGGALHSALGRNPKHIGVALSGGGDSTALLVALHDHLAGQCPISAVTVDHGLRADAAVEAAAAADLCASLGVSHRILTLDGLEDGPNLQDRARARRYAALAEWAQDVGVDAVLLGHTRDDVAEGFLLRLARGSGVDGLAEMSAAQQRDGVLWLRPFLRTGRDDLRAYLIGRGIAWSDDPSNDDDRFDRVRMRKALPQLAELGLTVDALADTARHMRRARGALDAQVVEWGEKYVQFDAGEVRLAHPLLTEASSEISLRLLKDALCWVATAPYPPRFDGLARVHEAAAKGENSTLHGCLILSETGAAGFDTIVAREPKTLEGVTAATDQPWDKRWRFDGPHDPTLEVRALGVGGLTQCPDWREVGRPRRQLLTSPAIWRGESLIAAPLAGLENGWTCRIAETFLDRKRAELAFGRRPTGNSHAD